MHYNWIIILLTVELLEVSVKIFLKRLQLLKIFVTGRFFINRKIGLRFQNRIHGRLVPYLTAIHTDQLVRSLHLFKLYSIHK